MHRPMRGDASACGDPATVWSVQERSITRFRFQSSGVRGPKTIERPKQQ